MNSTKLPAISFDKSLLHLNNNYFKIIHTYHYVIVKSFCLVAVCFDVK